MRKKF